MCAKIAQNHETKEQKGENSQSAGLPLFVAPLKMKMIIRNRTTK